jgi:AraC family transcriptional regulator
MASERKRTEATLRDYKERILRVLVHIQQHLDDALGLEGLAAVACFSPFHFHRVFKGMIGESVKEHVRRLRLERAAVQLKLGGRPVTQIALDAGYEAHEAFTRAFKTVYGVAPIRFRSQRRASAAVAAPSGVHYRADKPLQNFKTKRTGGLNMNVRIKTVEPMRVAFVRHVGPYNEVNAAWDKLVPLLGKEGLIGGDSLFIGICHDDPEVTPPEKIRYDACVTVDESFAPTGDLGVQTISGGEYAMTTHRGPYQKLGATYTRLLGQWLPRSGRELSSSPCFEIYLNDPESTEPGELLTDIYVPLQPKSAGTLTGVRS